LCWWHEQRISVKQRDVQQARRERMPFVSSLLDGAQEQLSPLDLALREVHHAYGIVSNIVVPVHLPSGITSLVGWTSATAGAATRVEPEVFGALLAVAHTFVDTIERYKAGDNSSTPRSRLSNRERQCLQLIAAGYSMKEAARALTLSPFTVREYLGNAMRRLGAGNLPQLVSLAWQRAEISPPGLE
ncbi:helix-turn-helix transcriptional regulator, partial [Pseudomonas sp. NPDC089569]|uniref:helix-turn-helix transcriptional regulator n=1 Tax=Pseudomonas sp. NPDC089569 TaxID=3390722 RepID=UPI003D049C0F